MKESTKTTIKSIAVLLCIAIVSGFLLAVCNAVFYVQVGGMADFEKLYSGNWAEAELDESVTLTSGAVETVAEIGDDYVGFIATGNAVAPSNAYKIIAIVDRSTNKVIAADILVAGESAPTYALDDSIVEEYYGVEITSSTIYDTAIPDAIQTGATKSSNTLQNAFRTVAGYYAAKYLGLAPVDPSVQYLAWLNELAADATFTAEDIDTASTYEGGSVLYVGTATTTDYGRVVGMIVKSTNAGDGANVVNGPYTLAVLIKLADNKLAAAKIVEAGETMDMYAVSETVVQQYVTYTETRELTATLFDDFNDGLIATSETVLDFGETGSGYTQSSKTVKNAFRIVAKYYTAVYGDAQYLSTLQTWKPTATFTRFDKEAGYENGKIKYVATTNDNTVVFVVVTNALGISRPYTLLIEVDRTTDSVISSLIVVDGYNTLAEYMVPVSSLEAYYGTAITSTTVFDAFEAGLISSAELNAGGTSTGTTQSSRNVRNAFIIVAQYYTEKTAELHIGG